MFKKLIQFCSHHSLSIMHHMTSFWRYELYRTFDCLFFQFSPPPLSTCKNLPTFWRLITVQWVIHLANDSNFCTFTYRSTLLKYSFWNTCSNNYQLLYYKHHSNEYVCEQNVSNIQSALLSLWLPTIIFNLNK